MKEARVVVFSKEKYGVGDALAFLRDNFTHVDSFQGKRGDKFPEKARRGKYDICVSYMSPWIIPAGLLSAVKEFSINFHPGPPEYRGIGCTNFAVYNNESQYGVTAHLMTSKVDSGRIISVKRFPVLPDHSLVDITSKCYQAMLEQFFEVFNHYLKHGKLPDTDAKWSKRLYTREELNQLCRIEKEMGPDEVKGRVRATSFPDMPQAYVELYGRRFEYKE